MRNLSVGIVQCDLAWQDPPANRARIGNHLAGLAGVDLAVLPEMFATGFTMEPAACAEDADGPSLAWMREQAVGLGAAVAGSLAVRDPDGSYRNRLHVALPTGEAPHYDKRHLFRMAGEQLHYAAGAERRIVQWQGWRLCPMVCYDLRFPVWSRNRGDYDVLLYVANWPARRREHWRALLLARAIENQCFVIGVNRTGVDGKGIDYAGDSVVIDPWGRTLLDAGEGQGTHEALLEAAVLEECRERFPVQPDADAFELR